MKQHILTGLRSNNDLTIGNYFGALQPILKILKSSDPTKYQVYLFVPDLHSFTTPINHESLYLNTLDNIRTYLGVGDLLEKSNIYLYRQSYVPAHSELTWILDCFASFGELSRMIQFKDKSKNSNSSVGLFNYPVLMAADILLYKAKYVPVGEDQTQHLEFTRNIAIKFNKRFGNIFEIPETNLKQAQLFEKPLRIKDLINPEIKMSKSSTNEKGTIFLKEEPSSAARKIITATTDSDNHIFYDPKNKPGISNLIQIDALLSNQSIDQIVDKWSNQTSYRSFKEELAQKIKEFLEEFQSKINNITDQQILNRLVKDEQIINQEANSTLYEVQKAVGLRL
jgi:tryptophanyl-tRNA synthetase